MMYYLVISAAVTLFAFSFLFNQRYENNCGNSLKSALIFSLGANIVAALVLFAINGFKAEFTVFTFIVATVAALNSIIYSVCSIKALGKINLSLYSVFAMLGGMALPFFAGILFFNEDFTAAKAVCFIAVASSLFFTVKKGENKNGGTLYYVAVFICNGMSGVLAKFFQTSPFQKTGNTSYSLLIAVMTALISAVITLFLRNQKIQFAKKAAADIMIFGTFSSVGNLLLLISLEHLPASAQYPFVTGGVMIISTVICFFTKNKPSKRELISVAVAFAGILALVIIPF